jgi:beta-lactamase regulating signal transducer with metallopeptidase domain
MAWVSGVTALIMLTAAVAERVAVRLRWPSRWLWTAGLASVVLLATLPPGRRREIPVLGEPGAPEVAASVPGPSAVASTAPWRTSRTDRVLALLWFGGSLAVFGRFAYVVQRLRRLRRRWSPGEMDGQRVWITDTVGPALVGILRPRVAVPRWLEDWAPDERRMVLRHELEHASARDPWLNAFGALVSGLTPWNPFLWWARARLVQAIETDCDARVLRSSTDPRSYARVLLEVARWTVPMRPSLATLAVTSSQLERRIEMAMKHDAPRRLAIGTSLLAVAGFLAVSASVPRAPERPPTPYLAGLLPSGSGALPQEVPPDLGGGAIPGRLPFTPTPEQTSTALATHHPRVLARGLSEDRVVWFVIDSEMRILHTGVGLAEGLHERLRSLHPESVTDYAMEIEYQSVDGLTFQTVWFVPEPPEVTGQGAGARGPTPE